MTFIVNITFVVFFFSIRCLTVLRKIIKEMFWYNMKHELCHKYILGRSYKHCAYRLKAVLPVRGLNTHEKARTDCAFETDYNYLWHN